MAATEATPQKYFGDKTYLQHGVAASTTIYGGSFLALDADGYAVPLTTSQTKFLGIAEDDVDNSSGVDNAKTVRVAAEAIVELAVTGAGVTSVGSTVYANDSNTIDLVDAGSDVAIGKIVQHVTGTTCLVKIQATALQSV